VRDFYVAQLSVFETLQEGRGCLPTFKKNGRSVRDALIVGTSGTLYNDVADASSP